MKNRLKFLFIIPMFLVSIFLGVNVLKNVSAASAVQGGDFEVFSNSYMELLKDNSFDDYEEISFNLNNDIYKRNNTYMVDSTIFSDLTGSKVSIKSSSEVQVSNNLTTITMSNDENIIRLNESDIDVMPETATIEDDSVTFPIESVAEALGFDLRFDDDNLFLSRPYQTKRLIIKSNSTLDKQGAIRYAEGYNGLHIYQYATEEDTINAYNYYDNLACVDYVEVDSIITPTSVQDEKTNPSGVEDDFSYTSWGADAMGVEDYSNYLLDTIGSANLPEIIVAVLDTGLDSDHPWFLNRIANGGANYSSSISSTSYEWEDVYGHGTHVSGIITDLTLSNVKILPIKVMCDEGYGYTSQIILGINYVTEQKVSGRNIVAMNLSLGGANGIGSDEYNSYSSALSSAYNSGIIPVVAAGNDGADVVNHTPANVECAITVSAVGMSGALYYRPSWSNFGEFVDVCAPGHYINSACVGGGVVSMSGTSMAAPHVAGAIALLYSDNTKNYTKTDIENLLDVNTIDLGSDGWDDIYGEGLINLEYAYAELMNNVTFSHTQTDCTETFNLTLTVSQPSAKIYYTTDGSTPTLDNGTLYSSPILVNKTQRIKARAYVLSSGVVEKYTKVSQMTYCFYGQDVEGAYIVNEEGVLTSYAGVLTEITVPKEVNGITITSIGENAFSSSSVVSVTLPSTVIEIGANAFYGCSTIEWVSGFNVKRIGKYAFSNCVKFKYLNDTYFPNLEVIDKFAFDQCFDIHSISLTNLKIVEDYGVYVFMQNNPTPPVNLQYVNLPNAETIGAYAFMGANYLTSINLPNVKVIGAQAFRYAAIIDLFLPEVEYLGNYAFYAQHTLKTVDCPKTIYVGNACFYDEAEIISLNMPLLQYACEYSFRCLNKVITFNFPELIFAGEEAFAWGESVESVYMPKLEYAGSNCFQYLAKLTSIELPSIRELGNEVFRWSGRDYFLNSITLSPCIERIGINVFKDHDDVPNLIIKGYENTILQSYCAKYNLTFNNIGNMSAFTYKVVEGQIHITGYNQNLELETLVIPSIINNLPVTKICNDAFVNCNLITEINSDNLIYIGENAFENCINLTRISLPNIETIENFAFVNCTNLNDVIIDNASYIGEKAFYNNIKLLKIIIKNIDCDICEFAIGYNDLGGIETQNPSFIIEALYNSTAELYANENNLLFKAHYQLLEHYYYNTFVNTETGNTEVMITYVDRYLAGNFIIPSSCKGMPITKIDSQAFTDCSFVTGIQLPESITTIGYRAFCSSGIREINLNYVTTIDSRAFESCSQLENVYIPNILELPDGCFSSAGLVYLSIPNVTTIGNTCFAQCTRLQQLYAPNAETIGDGCFSSCHMIDNISLPKLTYLPNGAISGCYSLKSCYLPELIEIECSNFNYCKSLEIVNFLPKVEIIGEQCFMQDQGQRIKEVYLPSLRTLSGRVFTDAPFATDDAILIFAVGKNITTFSPTVYSLNIDKLYGYSGTIAETFATNNDIDFVAIDELGITTNLPTSKEVNQYDEATLSIVATGFEQTYQWYMTDDTIANGVAIEGATSSTITLDTTTIGTKYYYVVVTDWDATTITSNLCEVTVISDSNTRYKITATVIGNGTMTNSGDNYLLEGSSKTFTFTPNTGYHIRSIIVDSVALTGDELTNAIANGYTFSNITNNHTITVTFVINTYTITVIQAENGTISEAQDNYNYGTSAYFTITANAGYHVEYLLIDGEVYTDSLTEYRFTNITDNHTISALFTSDTNTRYTIKHWQESLTQTGATLIGTKYYNLVTTDTSKTGATGELTQATANTYTGFTALAFEQQAIVGGGSTVIDILYDRNIYAVNLVKGQGINNVSGAGDYLFGQTVRLNATLNEGYKWLNWESSNTHVIASSSNIEYSFTMPASAIGFTANATIKQFNITISSTSNGHITPSTNQVVNYGANLELEFEADFGYELVKVLIDGNDVTASVVDNKYTITNIKENHTVSATFDLVSYSITAQTATNGTISPSGITSVKHGNNQKYTFTANTGYYLASVLVDGVALTSTEVENVATNGYTFTNVVANHTISATFAINTYSITASANSYGTITPSGNIQANYGDDKTFTFEAYTGYQIDKVYVDGVNVGNSTTYTFEDVCEDHEIYVTFSKLSYTITATSSANGSISPEGTSNVLYGEGLNYTFTPNTGHKVKDVKVNNASVGAVNSYSFSNVTSNQTISVEFEKIVLTINVICGDNGTVSPSGEISVEYGTSKTFTIIPDENYGISYVELNGERIGIKHSVVINNITENQTLKVAFAQIFLITSISDENGSITPSSSVALGNQKRFDFFPNVGYKIKDVKIDNVSIGAVSHYTFVNVDRAHTISVEYEIQKFNISLSVDGQGSLDTNSALKNITYGENRTFTISAEEGWELFKVYINGRSINVSNNQLVISDIDEDMNIQAIFKEKAAAFSLDSTSIAIIIGTVIISILLIALLIKSHKNANRRKLEDSKQNVLVPENEFKAENDYTSYEKPYQMPEQPARPQPPQNPTLQNALNFVQDKQDNFISFCNRYNIDYKNNYNNAVLIYYQAYLRSIKPTQPPKNN